MNFQQTRDVVAWSAAFHARLTAEYERLESTVDDARIKQVLSYLIDHEKEIEKGLRDHLKDAEPALLGGWTRGEAPTEKVKQLAKLEEGVCCDTVDQLMNIAIDIHKGLEDMYGELAGYAELADSRELLKSLRDHEEAETRRMVRDIGWYEAT